MPLLIVANEFFDALPVRQLVATERGWRERLVGHDGTRFVPVAGAQIPDAAIPHHLRTAPPGTLIETSPASVAIVGELARRIARDGGVALIIDYGHVRTAHGETLQAVAKHGFADPWISPGEQDLTAHVDFEALADAARAAGVKLLGPRTQGDWLRAMGIALRAASLAKAAPDRVDEICAARQRLTAPDQMGSFVQGDRPGVERLARSGGILMSVEVIRARVLGAMPHGFLGRRGGVSTGVCAGLNVGLGSDDDPRGGAASTARARSRRSRPAPGWSPCTRSIRRPRSRSPRLTPTMRGRTPTLWSPIGPGWRSASSPPIARRYCSPIPKRA